jgi:hypothetical protein
VTGRLVALLSIVAARLRGTLPRQVNAFPSVRNRHEFWAGYKLKIGFPALDLVEIGIDRQFDPIPGSTRAIPSCTSIPFV